MIGIAEQIALVRAHRRQAIYELRVNEDMTSGAGTTSTAKAQAVHRIRCPEDQSP